jgi:exo-beta-1,3-glucanase (GH17 family)
LLAADAFAIYEGVLPATGGADSVTIEVSKSQFSLGTRGRVILELTATSGTGARLVIGAPLAAKAKTVGPVSSSGAGWRIAALAPGRFTFPISGGAPGVSYKVNFSLVGDVHGDGVVNQADIKAIRSRLGVGVNSRRYLYGADAIPNNRIGRLDLRLAISNLHARTSLKPLAVSATAVQSSESGPLANLVVQSQPGATVTLTERGVEETSIADRTGKATFAADLLTGVNVFYAGVTDSFGQKVINTVTVNRGALSNYLGAAFGPYVGQWMGTPPHASLPLYNSYGAGNDSVAKQISLVAPQFASLATYGAGYASYYSPYTPYNQVDSAWMVGGAAAAYNQSQGAAKVTVSQGIFQQLQPGSKAFDLPLMDAEANGAISIAKSANSVYAGTVTRLIFTNEFVTDATTTNEVYDLINKPQGQTPSYKDQAHSLNLEVGVRSNTFGQLTDSNSPYLVPLQNLVKSLDFIMLNLYPTNEATQTPQQWAADVASQYNKIRAAARAVNPNIDVLIGETGWPSQGVSFNDLVDGQPSSQDNTVANEQAYFSAIQAWANQNQVETHWFEAIDEPWKSDQNNSNTTNPQGINGAEGHYGLWTYNSSGPDGQFIEKFSP